MKKMIRFLLILIGFCLCLNADVDFKKLEGKWISIFNKQNLDGWIPKFVGVAAGINYKNTFRVIDGKLTVAYDEWDAYQTRCGHLLFHKTFDHYILRAKYRFRGDQLKGGALDKRYHNIGFNRNNGLMLHAQNPYGMKLNQFWPVSYEVQLLGGIEKNTPRTTLNICTLGTSSVLENGKRSSGRAESTSETIYGEEWVECLIVVRGQEKIEHYINGKLVSLTHDLEYHPKNIEVNRNDILYNNNSLVLKQGLVGIQAESAPTEFEYIDIMPISPNQKLPRKQLFKSDTPILEKVKLNLPDLQQVISSVDGEMLHVIASENFWSITSDDHKVTKGSIYKKSMQMQDLNKYQHTAYIDYFKGYSNINRFKNNNLDDHESSWPLNDLKSRCFDSKDGEYFISSNKLYYRDASKNISEINVNESIKAINLSNDQRYLYFSTFKRLFKADIIEAGKLKNIGLLYEHNQKFTTKTILKDTLENLYIGSENELVIMNSMGEIQQKIRLEEPIYDMCFGGINFQTLFCMSRTGLFKVNLNVRGMRKIIPKFGPKNGSYNFLNSNYNSN